MNILGSNSAYFSGIVVYKRGGRFGPRLQEDLQLVYIHEGEAHITVDGTSHYLGSGKAALLLPGRDEFFQFSEKGRTRHGWCGLRCPQIDPGLLKQLQNLAFSHAFTPRMRTLEKLFLPLREATDSAALQQLHGTLVHAMVIEFLHQTGILEHTGPPRHPGVDRACAFIREQFRENLDLTAIAARGGVTPAHLIRLFKEYLQTTPKAYLWQIRTEAAARLLRNTGLSAAEVAYQCGFTNPHHFSRVFRQYHGLPPRAWRMREWGLGVGPD